MLYAIRPGNALYIDPLLHASQWNYSLPPNKVRRVTTVSLRLSLICFVGGSYSFGMRICPIRGDGRSVSSHGSNSEYEVWRRWEDCLWFQDQLELEYERMSRSKRQSVFLAGKGVKKNGVYVQSDQASSWESLPPVRYPSTGTQKIHDYVANLTKERHRVSCEARPPLTNVIASYRPASTASFRRTYQR